jgi:hypothetical protein
MKTKHFTLQPISGLLNLLCGMGALATFHLQASNMKPYTQNKKKK